MKLADSTRFTANCEITHSLDQASTCQIPERSANREVTSALCNRADNTEMNLNWPEPLSLDAAKHLNQQIFRLLPFCHSFKLHAVVPIEWGRTVTCLLHYRRILTCFKGRARTYCELEGGRAVTGEIANCIASAHFQSKQSTALQEGLWLYRVKLCQSKDELIAQIKSDLRIAGFSLDLNLFDQLEEITSSFYDISRGAGHLLFREIQQMHHLRSMIWLVLKCIEESDCEVVERAGRIALTAISCMLFAEPPRK